MFHPWPFPFLEPRLMPFWVKGSYFISCLAGFNNGMLVSTRINRASVCARGMCACMNSIDVVLGSGAVSGAQRCWLNDEAACWNHFLLFFLCWGHLFRNHCHGRLSERGHLGVYEASAHIYQSQTWACLSLQLEKGQTHSLGWDLSDGRYQSHLNLTHPPAVPAVI